PRAHLRAEGASARPPKPWRRRKRSAPAKRRARERAGESEGRSPSERMKTAADLGVPEQFNAAVYFIDRHLAEGRGGRIAIECGDERVTYAELAERVNRCGSALRDECRVRAGERVVLLLLDGPAFFYAFFGAIKIGAVPVPVNTLWKTADYRYVSNDSGARVAIVSDALLPSIDAIPKADVPELEQIVVAGRTGTFDA